MSELPAWVYNVVMALQQWNDEHPMLYAQYNGSDEYRQAHGCGCEALEFVPAEVATTAKELRRFGVLGVKEEAP